MADPLIPLNENEIDFSAIRAQGAGGQNVNKVSSAIHLRYDIPASTLPDVIKERLLALNDQRITSDGIVRYVVVAQSPSGTVYATYEGIRCLTAEVKVYARYTSSKVWSMISKPEWKSLRDNQPSPHALAFARQGACDGRSTAMSTPQAIVDKLKTVERSSLHK